jgi:hypothetical protein
LTRAKMSVAFREIDLGSPVGLRRFALVSILPELSEVGRSLKDCDFFSYTYLSGFRTAVTTSAIALLPLPETLAVRMMRNSFRRNHLPVDGFVWTQVVGRCGARKLRLTAQIAYHDRRDYWIHGLTLATVARLVSEAQGVKAGVHFLADAVDSTTIMAELRKAGVEQTQSLSSCN